MVKTTSGVVVERLIAEGVVAGAAIVGSEGDGTHGGVGVAINVENERPRANCRIDARKAGSGGVIIRERVKTHGGVTKGINVSSERLIANCRVAAGIAVSGKVVIEERLKTNGRVPGSGVVEKQRKSTNGGLVVRLVEKERTNADGGVQSAINVILERLNSNCRVAAGIAESATIII